MTLHEAIISVIRKHGEPMKPRDIALEINKYALYAAKSEKPVSVNQVWARANRHQDLFEITTDQRIREQSADPLRQDDFIRWINEIMSQHYGQEYEIIIPYILFLFRRNQRTQRLDYHSIIADPEPKKALLRTLDDIFIPDFPSEFFKVIHSAIDAADPLILKNILISFERFTSFIESLPEQHYQLIFKKTISQVSNTRSRNSEFTTPLSLASFIAQLADVKPYQSISDPFAGACILLSEVATRSSAIKIVANDISKKAGVLGIMNLLISGVHQMSFTFKDAYLVNHAFKGDWIISNPPFAAASNKNFINDRPAVQLIYDQLPNKGNALVVVPDSFLYSADKKVKKIRDELLQSRSIRAVISLPINIFQPFTGVSTSLLFLQKGVMHNDIYFQDLSTITNNDFGYKCEEYAAWYRQKRVIADKSAIIRITKVRQDKSLNLLPRNCIARAGAEQLSNFETVFLKEIVKKKVPGKKVSSANLNEDKDGIPFLRISDLPDDPLHHVLSSAPKKFISDIELINAKHFVESGTIAVATLGNNLKPTLYNYPEPAIPSNHLFCFTITETVSPGYLLSELRKDYVKQQLDRIHIRGVGPSYYREKDLLDIRIKLPSADEQDLPVAERSTHERYPVSTNLLDIDLTKFIDQTDDELEKGPKKELREREIISSIKHRVSQFLSPINNDIRNLKYFFIKKSEDQQLVALTDKINDLPDATAVVDLFLRMENNLSGVARTFQVINDILYFDKTDSKLQLVNFKMIVESVIASTRDQIGKAEIVFALGENTHEKDLILSADENQLEELLRNFIFNSYYHGFKHLPSLRPVIYILVTKSTDSNFLEIHLINNGRPFPIDFTKEDFIAFGRKGAQSDGDGIGGYLMNQIVENHGGRFDWFCNQNIQFTIDTPFTKELRILAVVYFKFSFPYNDELI